MRLRQINRGNGTTSLWLGILFLFISCFAIPAIVAAETINYTYDDAYRLTQVASTGYVEDYTYDEVGNRTLKTTTLFDVTPPETTINSTPASLSNSATATFTFSSSEAGSTFACQIDNGAWAACNSGTISYDGLADSGLTDEHSFAVKATDLAVNEDQTPAIYRWRIDTALPSSTITYPSNNTGIISSSYTIKGSASDVGSGVSKVEISINNSAWTQVTGTTSWSYNWSIPSGGPYSIRTRATDASGNPEAAHDPTTVTAYVRTPSNVTTSGRQLLLNSSAFTVMGLNYSPVPVGETPETVPYGDYFTSDQSGLYNRDLPQLRQMGANVVSLWSWDSNGDHAGFLDAAYNGGVSPIYVIAGYHINAGQNIADANVREQIKSGFRDMIAVHKDHPAILLWAIGNDLNSSSQMYGADKTNLFSLIEEMAAEAHAEDPNHPVMMPLADENLVSTIAAYGSSVPALDVWGANVYRGNSFGTLFSDYQTASSKPLLITGYGIDALNNTSGTEDENSQAAYAASLWGEIKANNATTMGGVLTEYSDEWWRGSLSTDTGCPEANDPAVHGNCGNSSTAMPDGYDNYEWWGVMRTADNGTGPDTVAKRAVFYRLQTAWCPPLLSAGPNNPTSGVNNASIGTVAWANPNNVRVSDNTYATVSVSNTAKSNYLVASGLNFAIPAGATINGIEVTIERKEGTSKTGIMDNSVKVVKNGTITGTEHAGTTAWGSTKAVATYGSQTDLWGTTWTPADINAANFGVAVSIKGTGTSGTETASVDNVTVKVYYTSVVTCARTLPTVSLAPASGTITTDSGSLPYTLTITNNDSTACASETFNLAKSDTNSTNFNASVLNPPSVSLAPGASDSSVILTVNAKAGQTSGTNNTSVTASSANHASVTSSAVTTTLNVATGPLSAGPNNPTSGVNNASIGTVAWSSPNNVRASDNIYATVSVGGRGISNYLVASGLSFAIPAGATIRGIEVKIERKKGTTAQTITDNSVKILKNGAITGTEHASATAWGSTEVVATYGSQTDLWGTTWTPADINAANFGVAVSIKAGTSGNVTASVDSVTVKVYYVQ